MIKIFSEWHLGCYCHSVSMCSLFLLFTLFPMSRLLNHCIMRLLLFDIVTTFYLIELTLPSFSFSFLQEKKLKSHYFLVFKLLYCS